MSSAKKGSSVAIKIVNESNPGMMYGRQFDDSSSLYSKLSRASIDALKEFFKTYVYATPTGVLYVSCMLCREVSKEEWQLIVRLKTVFNIS